MFLVVYHFGYFKIWFTILPFYSNLPLISAVLNHLDENVLFVLVQILLDASLVPFLAVVPSQGS